MTRPGTIALTAVTMIAFAANSVLCRLALSRTDIDPAAFTMVRIVSGAVALAVISALAGRGRAIGGSWEAALALFAYAAAFSFAYLSLPAGAGALILFGAVQATMVLAGLVRGEHLTLGQWLGLTVAIAGLIVLVAPGVSAPSLVGSALMAAAGAAWGAYSILGRRAGDPLIATAGNFLRAVAVGAGPGACDNPRRFASLARPRLRRAFRRRRLRPRLHALVRRPAGSQRRRRRLRCS